MSAVETSHAGPLCACGKKARSFCAVSNKLDLTIPLCREPICSSDGDWKDCKVHRHRPGTMGYYHATSEIRWEHRRWEGERSFWSKLLALWRDLTWSEERIALKVLAGIWEMHPPPAPLYTNVLVLFDNGHKWRSRWTGILADQLIVRGLDGFQHRPRVLREGQRTFFMIREV